MMTFAHVPLFCVIFVQDLRFMSICFVQTLLVSEYRTSQRVLLLGEYVANSLSSLHVSLDEIIINHFTGEAVGTSCSCGQLIYHV